jgi:hypothetical protein
MVEMVRGVALVVALAPAVAVAQDATQLFNDGRTLLQQGKAAEACAKFDAALKLDPDSPGVLLNLGLCNVQQHKVATALKWFRKAEAFPDVETVAKQQVTTLSALVPAIRIDAPPNATIAIDGEAVTDRAKIEIDAGHHVANVDGLIQPFDVTDDPSHLQVVTLHGAAPPEAPHHRAPWIVGGVGVGLVVASGAVGLVGRSEFNGSHDLATRQHWKNVVEYGGTSLFAAGCAAIGIAVALHYTSEHTTITPTAAPGQVGLSITGAF